MTTTAAATVPAADDVRPEEEWPFYYDAIAFDDLFVDKAYQRPLSTFWRTVRHKFKPSRVGVLTVAPRPKNRYAVIDGQTRLKAMMELRSEGRLRQGKAACLVYPDLSRAEEAKLFADLQTQRRGMRSYDAFRALLVAGQGKGPHEPDVQEALNVSRVTEAQGFSLSVDEDANTMKAVQALVKLWRVDETGEHLGRVLTVIAETWGTEDKEATSSAMLRGLSFVFTNQKKVDDGLLVERLSEVTPGFLKHRASSLREGRAYGGSAAHIYLGQAILNYYATPR
jgi:hypothetical protein